MKEKLTKTQEARIYCVKHGHAQYIQMFWGEVYCGRCGDKIGDALTGVFNTKDKLVIGCKTKECKVCPSIRKKLSKLDKAILDRRNKYPDKRFDDEWILAPIVFNESDAPRAKAGEASRREG